MSLKNVKTVFKTLYVWEVVGENNEELISPKYINQFCIETN